MMAALLTIFPPGATRAVDLKPLQRRDPFSIVETLRAKSRDVSLAPRFPQTWTAGFHDTRSHSRARPLGPFAGQFGARQERRHPVRRRPHPHAGDRGGLLSRKEHSVRRHL